MTEDRTDYATAPRPSRPRPAPANAGAGWAIGITAAALAALGLVALPSSSFSLDGLNGTGLLTLLLFAAAVAGWLHPRLDDTHVALAAAATAVLLGALDPDALFATLGAEPIWLLIAAFVLAAGVNTTGLPARLAIGLAARARGPRGLAHLITLGVVLTALLIPSTSGRAALLVPLHRALGTAFEGRPLLVRALALLLPTTVLLSAVATLVGAGAHLITSEILAATTGAGIGFAEWLLWGLPFAVVSSHLAAELVLLLTTDHAERRAPVRVDAAALRAELGVPEQRTRAELRALLLLGGVVLLWSTEPLHGLPPALVALAGALLITSPRIGVVKLGKAVGEIPWSLLLFMAATAALGAALAASGAATWLADLVLDEAEGTALLIAVVVVSTAAHLVVQSRSARSSVLVPLVVAAALESGLNPVALAFASTAAAGFCHTLPSSAKPVAMFSRLDPPLACPPRDLLRLSALLAPLTGALVVVFALVVWPHLGLPLF
ncbi:SLC13 family permease [Saccharopolyspora sp. CA-218241]|uniref:SLC13 family permease n=1 Tax=Saccharopolyspora sp. CA-218241 TaxID=3240027 RepID=UPI003D98CC17